MDFFHHIDPINKKWLKKYNDANIIAKHKSRALDPIRAFGSANKFSDAVKAADISLLTSHMHVELCLMRKNC
jgi:hypothetical protein